MKITYGIENNVIDITKICTGPIFLKDNIIQIPSGDCNRAKYFSDPIKGIKKKIFIENDGIISEYKDDLNIEIDILNNKINTIKDFDIETKLKNIHSKLKINYGSMNLELPEQRMAIKYLKGHEKVLEIGGNIGRNSLVISSILKNANNLVTLESNGKIAEQLIHNRDLNNMKFHIEKSALSKRKLIQKRWITKPSETLEDGFKWVNTITFEQLKKKYNIEFDTLVLDCEGAFYYILMDMPEILDNINLIIMENDYLDLNQKKYIDKILTKNNFFVDYAKKGGRGPCRNNFYEVWGKNSILDVQRFRM